MKNIFKYIAGMAFAASLAGCNVNPLPKFDDADAFVAFDVTNISVNEDAGTVSLPISIASLDARKTTVSYELVDGTAKQGENFEGEDESAVLSFDGKSRTGNIVIKIKNDAGHYTGDLTFSVKLITAAGLNLGANSECSITIADLDHPLGPILGTYTATAEDYFAGATATWTVTLMKDPNDTKVVWVDGFTSTFSGAYPGKDWRIYGNVSDDLKTITFPCGQTLADKVGSNSVSLWLFGGGSSVSQSGNVVFEATQTGFASENGCGMGYTSGSDGVSLYDLLMPGIVWTRN